MYQLNKLNLRQLKNFTFCWRFSRKIISKFDHNNAKRAKNVRSTVKITKAIIKLILLVMVGKSKGNNNSGSKVTP